MKEREPDFEDEKMRAWLRQPKEENWEGLGEDPTVLTIDEETEEIFESRTYRLRPTPEAFSLVLDILRVRTGEQIEEMPQEVLAKRRTEDGRITHLLVAVTGKSRRLLDRREWVAQEDYRQTVECFEQLPLSRATLSPPALVTLDQWRRCADGGPLSRSGLEQAANQSDMEQDSQWRYNQKLWIGGS
jgi:hypothetical protein